MDGFDEEEDGSDKDSNMLESGDDAEDSLPEPCVRLTSYTQTSHAKTSSSIPTSQSQSSCVQYKEGFFQDLNNRI